jgi:hypothetical protein
VRERETEGERESPRERANQKAIRQAFELLHTGSNEESWDKESLFIQLAKSIVHGFRK